MPSRLSLNSSRQLFRPVQLNDCVRLSDLRVRVAGALRCFDAAAADFLAPCDVGPPERMRSQAGEVAALGRGRLLSAADSGIPHRLTLVLVLREDPGFRVVMRQAGDPGAVAFAQGAECQRPPTVGIENPKFRSVGWPGGYCRRKRALENSANRLWRS